MLASFLGHEWHALDDRVPASVHGGHGKSAQFLLHTWLPDAMEGPTPVSALIHAATMVTAGVFMVARMSPLFEFAPSALDLRDLHRGHHGLLRRDGRLAQNDIKRVIAYSTCSQLGYMFVRPRRAFPRRRCSTCSRTRSSRRCCSSARARSSTRCTTSRTCPNMGGLRKYIPRTYRDDGDRPARADRLPVLLAGYLLEGRSASRPRIGAYGLPAPSGVYRHVVTTFMTSLLFLPHVLHDVRRRFPNGRSRMRAPSTKVSTTTTTPRSRSRRRRLCTSHGTPSWRSPTAREPARRCWSRSPYWRPARFSPAFSSTTLSSASLRRVLERRALLRPETTSSRRCTTFPAGAAAPNTDDARLPRRRVHVHRSTQEAGELGNAPSGLYRFLLNKWYFDEFTMRDFRASADQHRPLPVADGRRPNHRRPGPTAFRPCPRRDPRRRAGADGYLYHYAFAMLIGVAALVTFIFSRRERIDARFRHSLRPSDPAAGRSGLHPDAARRQEAARSNARWAALATTVLTFFCRLSPGAASTRPAVIPARREPCPGSPITIRFKLGVDGFSMPFILLTTFLMPFCILASWTRSSIA